MHRLKARSRESYSDEQKKIYDRLLENRTLRSDGHIGGPFDVWLLNPELFERCGGMGLMFEGRTSFEFRLVKIAIITTAQFYKVNFPFYVHSRAALREGVSHDVVNAIHDGEVPDFDNERDRLTYKITRELLMSHKLSDATYEEAVKEFDEIGVVEMVSLVGFYVMVALTLNTFRVPPPEDAESFPFPVE